VARPDLPVGHAPTRNPRQRGLSQSRQGGGHRFGMQTPNDPVTTNATVIDLVPITAACRELVIWYDRSLAGDNADVAELQRVMAQLRRLPDLPGRIGRDINLVISGGTTGSPGDTVGAIERLRIIANYNAHPSMQPDKKPRDRERRQRSKKRRTGEQAPLPGLDQSEGAR
jgi:hypothetical protein